MRLSRVVIKNLRSVQFADVALNEATTLVIGENNTGKSSFVHAIRLCLDVGLSSAFRMLVKDDVHCAIDQTQPFQVLVGVEFTGFEGNENEEALLHGTQIGDDRARLFYRFRPKRAVRELLAQGGLGCTITLEDFGWELFGGGNPAIDLTAIEWNTENADIGASSVGLQYLQSYLVAFLPALRDVEDASLKEITGPAFSLDVELGLSSPTFQAIVRNLIVLLSNSAVRQFEPRRNGLGLNNILYIAILIEHFRKRAAAGKSAGELILIEEPEAHLHPQLQATLIAALRELPFQVIATTHSTQVTSKAPLSSLVMLTQRPGAAAAVTTPLGSAALTTADRHDLERYLDATKSNLLFARRVMLVEGAAELLLLPPLVKKVVGIDFEREGISLVAIHGVHFGPFSRLFSDSCLPKRCAIVADADLDVGDLPDGDDPVENPNLALLEGPYVRAFVGATTFEREITLDANLPMLAAAAGDLGAPRVKSDLEMQDLLGGPVPDALRDKVLRTAKRFGKARFAQVAARHVDRAGALPAYVTDAIAWLREV